MYCNNLQLLPNRGNKFSLLLSSKNGKRENEYDKF